MVCAYAFAVAEHNADCGTIVTAPTCGACGVVPAVLKYMQEKNNFSDDDIIRALAVAGLVGNIVSTNASISGAECGCQAEIGTACSMAAAALLFRSWVVWSMKDYNMVVNQLINFLDVYAMGMAASLLYVKLTTLYPADRKRFIWQAAATLGVILAIWGLKELLQNQAGSSGQPAIQAGQMIRRPAFAAQLALLTLSLLALVMALLLMKANLSTTSS